MAGSPATGGSTSGGAGPSVAGSDAMGGTSSSVGSAGSPGAGGTVVPAGGSGGSGQGGSPPQAGGGSTTPPGTFSKPKGTIPNTAQDPGKVNLTKTDWKKGIVSPTLLAGKALAQPSVVNGHLVIGGNESFWFYDVSNPASPKLLSNVTTPGAKGGEAENHTISYARVGDTLYMVTLSGTGIDTWDITNASAIKHLHQLKIAGTNYGDYTNAIWGVSWQGQYIYVGATNNGIKVVDASNPASLKLAGEVPTSQFGGVSAGPLDAIGNVLVVTTPKENGGVATLDISDPVAPRRLAAFKAAASYIGMFYGRWIFLINPIRAWDVLTNPSSIGTEATPVGRLNTEGSEYMSFQDGHMFLGHVRAEISGTPGASKITVSDPKNMKVVSRVWGRLDLNNKNDDQFTIPIGNLLVIADDQAPYHGWFIAVHQAEPDKTAPRVEAVVPNDKATGVSTKSRIGLSFTDNIELATVNGASFIVRPVGGEPLPGKFGSRMGVVNFDPDQDLKPATTYEIVLPQGGVSDISGNPIAAEWKATFTTQ